MNKLSLDASYGLLDKHFVKNMGWYFFQFKLTLAIDLGYREHETSVDVTTMQRGLET